jgi:hypothetical protein
MPATQVIECPYTVDGLANFLGEVGPDGKATEAFKATFSALELLDGNKLKESEITGIVPVARLRSPHRFVRGFRFPTWVTSKAVIRRGFI